MSSSIDIHQVFADYFDEKLIRKIAYECSSKLSDGHICVDIDEYNKTHDELISEKELLESKWVTNLSDTPNVFVIQNKKIYLHRYFSYETEIVEGIHQLIAHEHLSDRKNQLVEKKELIRQLFHQQELEGNWQLVAAVMSYLHNFSIITGGPGTGKTTTIVRLLALAYTINPDIKVALVAPTGKAAMRIKETILASKLQIGNLLETKVLESFDKIHSSTIHRLLGYKQGTHYFKHDIDNPLDYDLVIVDESSMIGVSLMAKLIRAIPSDKQLIFLGDKNQLASVEAGSVFSDICQSLSQINRFSQDHLDFINQFSDYTFNQDYLLSKPNILSEHIVELQKSYRFDIDKGIGRLSRAILQGTFMLQDIDKYASDGEVQFFTDYKVEHFESFYNLYRIYISEKDTLKALQEFAKIRLLSPTHKGKYSVDYFNVEIERYLRQSGLLFPKAGFYHNQPIMITKNDYQLKLFNGDIGLIRENNDGELQAYFEAEDGGLRAINPNFIGQYRTVFAMTIHKSQGSEFDQVAMVLPKEEIAILSKELLYTGLTRAKTNLWIFSNPSILEVSSQKPVQRASGIADRLL